MADGHITRIHMCIHSSWTAFNGPDNFTYSSRWYFIYLAEHTPMLKRSGWRRAIQRSAKISCERASPFHDRGSAEEIPRLEKSIKSRKMMIIKHTSAQYYSHLPGLWICSSSFPRRHDAPLIHRCRSSSPSCHARIYKCFVFDFTDLRIIRSAPPPTIVHLWEKIA